MIIERTILNPITYEFPPDGGKVPIIDPYDGCQLCCPYCWQLNDENWNKDIYVNINIADLINEKLSSWDKSEIVYIGSRCDPYMQLEEEYGLTRKCLSVLNELGINTMITTKSDNSLIFRDIDILRNFNADITVLMGISNVNQIEEGVQNNNILTANNLVGNGVPVWVFITPVLPYIMDVEEIIDALNADIPIFLDKLRIEADTIQADKLKKFIRQHYPEYIDQYNKVINENDERYYDELTSKYASNSRIKILF
ncbi:MAG: hypothetical protein LBI19_04295 [Oscillospiraceae bacterium]|jgi:DNA repair photolyase|nr:hypothetical protein [Oscillospiraceae bacterium]